MAEEYRIESDTFGDLKVPAGVYWGAQTQRYKMHIRCRRVSYFDSIDPLKTLRLVVSANVCHLL